MSGMPNSPRTPHRSVRVEDELWQAALDKTQREGTTVAAVVNQALRDYVDEDEPDSE